VPQDEAVVSVREAVPGVDLECNRRRLFRRGLRLEFLTVGWNIIEGSTGVAAALAAGSVGLRGFGIDSLIESASGAVPIWRLGAERRMRDASSVKRIERRAQRLVAASLLVLAVYNHREAILRLSSGERPGMSRVGIGVFRACGGEAMADLHLTNRFEFDRRFEQGRHFFFGPCRRRDAQRV
jgi:hypothetical protein